MDGSMQRDVAKIFRGVYIQGHPSLQVKGANNLGRNLQDLLALIKLPDLQQVVPGGKPRWKKPFLWFLISFNPD